MAGMHLGQQLFLVVLTITLAVGALTAPAAAATPTTLTVTAPAQRADETATVQVDLRASTGEPVAGVPVTVERQVAGAWQPVTALTTDAAGRATFTATTSRRAADNTFRASYGGDATYAPATGAGSVPSSDATPGSPSTRRRPSSTSARRP